AQREKARIVIETFRGYPEVEINHAFPTMLRRFDQAMEELISVQRKHALLGVLPSLITESVLALSMALLVLFSLSSSGEDMRLLFGIFAVAALRLMPSIRNVMTQWATIKYNRYTVETLREAKVDEGCETSLIQAKIQPLPFRQEIELRNVSFAFDDAPEKPVIQNLSLAIRKGERIGIRGTSGAGKTTLFHLLLGLYTPTRGEILIDGEPLTERNRRAWQNNIGYVSQTVFLTDATFAENVALGEREEEIDLERVRQALKQAQLESLIESLPLKEKTPIGECGCRLSGGQRQRIGIARALYKGAHVLLFDEATSALDSQTEEEINRSIERLFEQRKDLTLLVIAHRETSLEHCDRIIDL
ncbi:MAG: ABC transporter ATP-binding protein, partial [Alistipes sp.]|nr:ABC transporter ATP-binding protein [Alistipes sp.]